MDLKNRIFRLKQDLGAQAVSLTTSSNTKTDKRVDDLIHIAYCRGAIDTLHKAIKDMELLVDCYESEHVALDALHSYYGSYLAQQAEADPIEPDALTRGQAVSVNFIIDKFESLFSDLQREKSAGSHAEAYIKRIPRL